MKIEIEYTSSYEASLLIDGRKLKIGYKAGVWTMGGIKEPETSSTLGGLVASHLMSPIIDILQASFPDSACEPLEAWEKLEEETAEEIENAL